MSSRAQILDRVRRNQPAWRELPEIPSFERPLADPWAAFGSALARMGGSVAVPPGGVTLDAFIGGFKTEPPPPGSPPPPPETPGKPFDVTEYGAAELRGRTTRERAKALAELAHPDFRDRLRVAAATLR